MTQKKSIDRVCSVCGTDYLTRPADLHRTSCCSVQCRSRKGGLMVSHGGSSNANWRGGISEQPYRYTKLYRERHPEKVRAGYAVRRALEGGRLQRGPCVECGITDGVHAHHNDYTKPLDVVWLCDKHHRIKHGATC